MNYIEQALINFGNYAWGMPLLVLLIGGGSFFMIYSRFLPFKYFGHAINILRGKYDDPNDPGEISHYQALSGAIAATVGMGNISGVAVAIMMGGPGALVWMWLSALVGVATKFFTCSLAVMYRGKDSEGNLQGGPMYVIMEGMGKQCKPLAILFVVAGMFGVLPVFQANQLTEIVRELVLIPYGITGEDHFLSDLMTGIVIVSIVSIVTFGGLKRIATVAGQLVPLMILVYIVAVSYIILSNLSDVPASFGLIFSDAFSGDAILGGALGALIVAGVRRAAFSNEAGIGNAPMMHGAAKTNEPIREGLVAMLGPAIDTIIVCTMTALAILITGTWEPQIIEGKAYTMEIRANKIQEEGQEKVVAEIYLVKNPNAEPGSITTSITSEVPLTLSSGLDLQKSIGENNIKIKVEGADNIALVSSVAETAIVLNISQAIGADAQPSPNEFIIKEDRSRGIAVTAAAFNNSIPYFGGWILTICVIIFALTTMFSMSYYGQKCFSFLFGAKYKGYYTYFFVATIIFGAVASIQAVISLIDGMYATMAVPTMVSALYLSPKVSAAAKDYFKRMKEKQI